MPRLTLRTLLAYLDDTLEPEQARALGRKVAESEEARQLIEQIRRVTRRRGLTAPTTTGDDADVSDPNTVAEYLSDNLKTAQVRELEETCLTSDVHLAEVAACHQILTLVLTEPVRVPPSANQRMYLLVDPPASDPHRKPGKTLPVGGVAPPRPDQPDSDDPDAALLLGMKRYAASDSWAGRIGLVAAVCVAAAALLVAVFMALPHNSTDRPEVSTAAAPIAPRPGPVTGGTPPEPGGGIPVLPPPKPADPKKEPVDPGMGKKPDDPKKDIIDPKVDPGNERVKPPLPGDDVVGEVKTKDVLVLSRGANDGGWVRIDPEKPAVRASKPVLALPGFRADVTLNTEVLVHLWGNVPEQVAMPQMVMQSRVVFHLPATGFDADITVEAGRVYLKTLKAAGAKVRVRLGSEVWDVTLRDRTTDVLVQLHTAFVPGAKAGDHPKSTATLAVVAGAARVEAPARFKVFENVAASNQVAWDSVRNGLSEPHPIIVPELFPDRVPPLEAEYGKTLQKVLTDAARSLTNPEGIRVLLKERLTAPFPDNLKGPLGPLGSVAVAFPTQLAASCYAAIMDGPDAADLLKDMIDTLGDRTRSYARRAVVSALSAWVALAPGNTELLVKGMIEKGWLADHSALIARLLRGYSSFALGDPVAVDQLVEYLDYDQIAVREAALGNLLAYFDPNAPEELRIDVARRGDGSEKYAKFVAAWKARAEEIKKKMAQKKP